jgi:hypothetical protein
LITDIHGSADYRANLIKVMAQRAVAAAGRANTGGTSGPAISTGEQSAEQARQSPLRRLLSAITGKPRG